MGKARKYKFSFNGRNYEFSSDGARDIDRLLFAVSEFNDRKPVTAIDGKDLEVFFSEFFVSELTDESLVDFMSEVFEERSRKFQSIEDAEVRDFALRAYAKSFFRIDKTMSRERLEMTIRDIFDSGEHKFIDIHDEDLETYVKFRVKPSRMSSDTLRYFDEFQPIWFSDFKGAIEKARERYIKE